MPRSLPRLVRLPDAKGDSFIALADLVGLHAGRMYRGYEILSEGAFRITRNSNLYLQEEESRSRAGVGAHGVAQPAQGRCGAAGD